jgi:hypothetical protein
MNLHDGVELFECSLDSISQMPGFESTPSDGLYAGMDRVPDGGSSKLRVIIDHALHLAAGLWEREATYLFQSLNRIIGLQIEMIERVNDL